ncbi:MAG: glycosyltransferase family 2 protein [Chlorobi bacterium]|nr:glycosyltransferase family 2 protein [Chlorobiota bacterium]
MSSEALCDIIIINWNSGDLLNNCIKSIKEGKGVKLISKIYIVDNASIDNSINAINSFSDIHIIKNDKNLGFAAACNQGIYASNSKYILFLNPDTELLENSLLDSFLFMENNSDIDVLGVKHIDIKKVTQKSCSRFPTLKNYFYDIIGLSKIYPKFFNPATVMTDWDHEESKLVDQVMGAFMFVRRDSIDLYGKFDEQFFVYYEDLDFARRVWDRGGKIYYLSNIEIVHEGGGITSRVKDLRLFYSLRSRLLYGLKYFPKHHFVILLILTLTVEPFTRVINLLFKLKYSEILDIFKGYKMLYGYLIRTHI